jgi:hypothetical protein
MTHVLEQEAGSPNLVVHTRILNTVKGYTYITYRIRIGDAVLNITASLHVAMARFFVN